MPVLGSTKFSGFLIVIINYIVTTVSKKKYIKEICSHTFSRLVSLCMREYSETCDERPLRCETDLQQETTVAVSWPYISKHLYL